jgi:hypothetical protein
MQTNISMMQSSTHEPDTSRDITTKLASHEDSGKIFSDEIAIIFQWLTFSTLCQAVAVFGIGSNIVNIICFIKQGFKDPINISFLGK